MDELTEARNFFKGWHLVSDLSSEDLEAALGRMTIRKFGQSDVIIKQNDKGDSFFIILTGSASVSVMRDDGDEITVASLRQGTTFGEMSILAGAARNATVRALESSLMIEIDQEGFNNLTQKSSVFKNAMDNLYLSRGLVTHLKMTPLFSSLSSQVVEDLISEAMLRVYHPGQLLCKRGEPADAFLLLKWGTFEIETDKGKQTIEVTGGGEPIYFGHEEALGEMPWKLSIKAQSRVEAVEIAHKSLIKLIDANPGLATRFAASQV